MLLLKSPHKKGLTGTRIIIETSPFAFDPVVQISNGPYEFPITLYFNSINPIFVDRLVLSLTLRGFGVTSLDPQVQCGPRLSYGHANQFDGCRYQFTLLWQKRPTTPKPN